MRMSWFVKGCELLSSGVLIRQDFDYVLRPMNLEELDAYVTRFPGMIGVHAIISRGTDVCNVRLTKNGEPSWILSNGRPSWVLSKWVRICGANLELRIS